MSDVIWSSLITLVASIGSVSISQLIRNKHEIKLKYIELNSTFKRDAINNFINATLEADSLVFDINNFYKALNILIPYIDETSSNYIGDIKTLVENGNNIKEINSELMKLTIYLNEKSNIKSIK
ncbi:MAG: hypothetical protein IJB83_02465 [Bacilli bacterium]|nr:hypothetical protein [Bacilli bacterium]